MLKYLLLFSFLFVFVPSARVAAYNFAPPVEPIAKQKEPLNAVKSTLALQKANWKVMQGAELGKDDILAIVTFVVCLLAFVGLPLGLALALAWLWISSLSILGIATLVIYIWLLYSLFNQENHILLSKLGLSIAAVTGIIYSGLAIIDIVIIALIGWQPLFWIGFGLIMLLLFLCIFALTSI